MNVLLILAAALLFDAAMLGVLIVFAGKEKR